MIKLSQAGKMPCKSFSIPAGKTCPGMFEDKPSGKQQGFDYGEKFIKIVGLVGPNESKL